MSGIMGLRCCICKQELRSSMGYFYGACVKCAKKAIDTAAKKTKTLEVKDDTDPEC